MHLGHTDSATGDGSKAGTLLMSGEQPWIELGNPTEKLDANGVAPARDRRAQDSSSKGNLRVQKVEFALQQETPTA